MELIIKDKHKPDETGMVIIKKFAKDFLNFQDELDKMINDGKEIDKLISEACTPNIDTLLTGSFANRKLFLVHVNISNKEKEFLFYKSLKGSGIKEINQFYPIPGFTFFDPNQKYYPVANGWFIKDSIGIARLYDVKIFSIIQDYLNDYENTNLDK